MLFNERLLHGYFYRNCSCRSNFHFFASAFLFKKIQIEIQQKFRLSLSKCACETLDILTNIFVGQTTSPPKQPSETALLAP